MLLVLTLMFFVFVVVFPMMYVIDIVKRGSANKHLLQLLPFQSDNKFFIILINIKHIRIVTLMFLYKSHY